jgi:hypothetical protein
MNSDFGIVYPLWTDPTGPGELLDRAIGEVGLNHLTVPVVTGAIERFRLNPAAPPHHFVTEGGWHYPPDSSCYQAGPVKPRTARWFGRKDVLKRVCDFARSRDVRVVFRIDLRAVPSLIEHEPHLLTRNAWGDDVPAAGLCVLNPNVRELLRGTLDDLSRYGPAGFQLEWWSPDTQPTEPARRLALWSWWATQLADCCFCPACQQAGTDSAEARKRVCVHLDALAGEIDEFGAGQALRNDTVLREYHESKLRDTANWLNALAASFPDQQRYLLNSTWVSESGAEGLGADAFDCVHDRLTSRDPAAEYRKFECAIRGTRVNGLALAVWRPEIRNADHLVRCVTGRANKGVTFFDFERLDEAPAEALTWLRQAVRYARRG